MDRFSEKQEQINQRRTEVSAFYPALWSKMIAGWKQPNPDDRVWLTYSANYLFRTNHIRWAIDPSRENIIVPAPLEPIELNGMLI